MTPYTDRRAAGHYDPDQTKPKTADKDTSEAKTPKGTTTSSDLGGLTGTTKTKTSL